MNPDYINAFITSIQNVFETMLQLQVQTDTPMLRDGSRP